MTLLKKIRKLLTKTPRFYIFIKFFLILTSLGFIIAAYNELATAKVMFSPKFMKPYCSYNFHHDMQACRTFLGTLIYHDIFEAVRFALAPLLILLFVWLYQSKSTKEKS